MLNRIVVAWGKWWRITLAILRLAYNSRYWRYPGKQSNLSKLSRSADVPSSLDMSDMRDHPTAGRRRRHKSPAAGYLAPYLEPPMLPDHLRADDDGPTCSDEERGAKRMRSISTTPRSVRGTDPDEYDRVMGVTSVGSREPVRWGGKCFGTSSESGWSCEQLS